MRYPRLKQRPPHFRLNPAWCPLKQGLVFAGLGNHPGSVRYEDSSHWKNVGQLTNMDPATDWVWEPELGRWALDFDGSNDYASGNNVIGAFASNQGFSVSVWFNSLAETNQRGVLTKGYSSIPQVLPWWLLTWNTGASAGQIRWITRSSASVTKQVVYTTIGSVWHHVCGVYEPTTARLLLYLDGLSVGTPATSVPADSYGTNAQNFVVGLHDGGGSGNYFLGRLADVVLHNRALSPPEIQALADLSNAMLEIGNCPLILPPRRKLFPAAVVGFGGRSQVLGGGILTA